MSLLMACFSIWVGLFTLFSSIIFFHVLRPEGHLCSGLAQNSFILGLSNLFFAVIILKRFLYSLLRFKTFRVERISDRVIAVDLVIGEQIVKVVSCYAPQAGRSQIEKEEFWRQVEGIIMNTDINQEVSGGSSRALQGYKLIWKGNSEGTPGVGVLVASELADRIIRVESYCRWRYEWPCRSGSQWIS